MKRSLMKRSLGSSDSLSALMTICPSSTDDQNQGTNQVYPKEFQSVLDGFVEEGCMEESGHVPEKKRRLNVEQVKALEKNFEVENKLEPERKVKLAQELGLQPRQVAVWFQNRRARWKTKQLERDYGVLKANYDALKNKFDNLQLDNEALQKEIRELKLKLQGDDNITEIKASVKDEAIVSETESEDDKAKSPLMNVVQAEYVDDDNDTATDQLNFKSFNSNNGVMGASLIFTDFKDGSSDSDSSAILNEAPDNMNNDNSPNAAISSPSGLGILQTPHRFLMISEGGSPSPPPPQPLPPAMAVAGFQFSDAKAVILGEAHKAGYQPQYVKIEEHNFFSGDESCSTFFCDDQPPTLHWYTEEWN